jgi:hypothetical protein
MRAPCGCRQLGKFDDAMHPLEFIVAQLLLELGEFLGVHVQLLELAEKGFCLVLFFQPRPDHLVAVGDGPLGPRVNGAYAVSVTGRP